MNLESPVRREGALALRPATPADAGLLLAVYASTREEEAVRLGWPSEEWQAFLRMQFEAQARQYADAYPHARFDVVLCDGEPVGRLYVARSPGSIHVIDIALLTAARNRGIGGELFASLLAEGDVTGATVSIWVEQFNRARRFYERLGFREVEEHGVYRRMVRDPEPTALPVPRA